MTLARGRRLPILAVTGLALIACGAGGLALSRSGGAAPGPPAPLDPVRVAAPAVAGRRRRRPAAWWRCPSS